METHEIKQCGDMLMSERRSQTSESQRVDGQIYSNCSNTIDNIKNYISDRGSTLRNIGYESQSNNAASVAWIGQVITCNLVGIVFGFVLEKGKGFGSVDFRQQMLLHNFVMLKMYLSAITTSLISLTLLCLIPSTFHKVSDVRSSFINHIHKKGIVDIAVGSILLGIGMTLSEACPEQVLVQIGHGVPNSAVLFIGCSCGALLYGLTESYTSAATKPTKLWRVHKIEEILSLSFPVMALRVAAGLICILIAMELFVPWETELTTPNVKNATTIFNLRSWPPYVVGGIVGILQIPILLSLNKTLGVSSSFCTIVSRLFPAKMLQTLSPYLYNRRSGILHWWQVIFVLFSSIGAYLSARLSDSIATIPGTSAMASFSGGLIMIFGSRMAGGCTCGHGLSGTGMLLVFSFVAVPFIFIGGFSTAVILSIFN